MADEKKTVEETTPETETKPEAAPKAEEAKTEEAPTEASADAEAEAKEPAAPAEPIVEENTDTKEAESAEIPEVTEAEQVEVEELPHKDLVAGMLVRVHEKIKDTNSKGQERERVQVFEGLVLGVRGSGVSRTATVRKNSKGWMVEKIFPLSSPNIDKIEVVKQYRARRAKLSYLRGKFKRKLREVKTEK